MTSPTPPAHLSAARKKLWKALVAEYAFEAHHLELLRLACEALDRCEQARKALTKDGLFTVNRYGSRVPHPAIAVERDSRLAAARLLRDLGFPEAPAT